MVKIQEGSQGVMNTVKSVLQVDIGGLIYSILWGRLLFYITGNIHVKAKFANYWRVEEGGCNS